MSSSSISGHRTPSPTISCSARDERPGRFAPSSTKLSSDSVSQAYGLRTRKDMSTPSGSSSTALTASSTCLPKRRVASTTSSDSGAAPNDSSSPRRLERAHSPRSTPAPHLPGRAGLRATLDSVLGLVWASRCAACDSTLEEPTRGVVCGDCWRQIELIAPPICGWCSTARPDGPGSMAPLCCAVPATGGPPQLRRAAGYYRGTLRELIHAFKYQGRRSLARPLASLMRIAGRDLLDHADAVVPVPLHPLRRWSRGFNQAEMLARHLDVPVANVLRRRRWTSPQASLAASARHRNVRDAFGLGLGPRAHDRVRNRAIVIVDDVATTGSTLEACAIVLRRAGALRVSALTAATTPPNGRHRLQPQQGDGRPRP